MVSISSSMVAAVATAEIAGSAEVIVRFSTTTKAVFSRQHNSRIKGAKFKVVDG